MKDLFNGAHKEFAAVARCYYGVMKATISVAAVGDNPAGMIQELNARVIEVDPYTVRILATAGGTAWTLLTMKHLRSLMKENGAPETWTAALPTNFFLHPGDAAAASGGSKQLGVYPPAASGSVTASNGLKYNAWLYPADITSLSATPVLAEHEHYRLVPWLCWQMAMIERSRGRANSGAAPVEDWYNVALTEALELREIFRRGMEEAPRTANVGMSSGEDAQERRINPMRAWPGQQVK